MQRPGSLDRGGGRNPLAQRRMLSGSSTSASSQEGVAATHCNRYDLADAVSDSIFEAAGGEAVLGGLSAEDRITHLVTRHNWHPMVALKVSEGFGTAGHSPSSPALRNPQPTSPCRCRRPPAACAPASSCASSRSFATFARASIATGLREKGAASRHPQTPLPLRADQARVALRAVWEEGASPGASSLLALYGDAVRSMMDTRAWACVYAYAHTRCVHARTTSVIFVGACELVCRCEC